MSRQAKDAAQKQLVRQGKNRIKKHPGAALALCAVIIVLYIIAAVRFGTPNPAEWGKPPSVSGEGRVSVGSFDFSEVPEYSGAAYVTLNDNMPYFTEEEITDRSYEYYSELDAEGRCGVCRASIGQDLMPTEKREDIGSVKPTGWHSISYDFIDGKSLYNRCHLIGFQLSGENANEKNLITGTRYLNVTGMLPFENMTADYVKETGNHVMYRSTPVFVGEELVARGVVLEGYSVEDKGDGVCFCVFCYNVQPGVVIDYSTGASAEDKAQSSADSREGNSYILNKGTKKFHLPTCPSAGDISASNKEEYSGEREALIEKGYSPCKACNP